VPAGRWGAVLGGTRIAKSEVWAMRHLLLAATMLVFGLGITLGTASVLQDVAVAGRKGDQSDLFEVTDVQPPKHRVPSQFAAH
jgi:hypothetical protein